MSSFKLRIDFDDCQLAKVKGNNISDFDSILDGLKEKFGEEQRRKK